MSQYSREVSATIYRSKPGNVRGLKNEILLQKGDVGAITLAGNRIGAKHCDKSNAAIFDNRKQRVFLL